MTNPYYTPSGTPGTSAQGSSSDMRSEFALIQTGMDKLPDLTADFVVIVNAGGTSLESVASLSVSRGGTGATTLTDGGILLGSGTGAITATAVLADGEMIVGDGTTDPAIESGATLRTSIGVGTGDSPTFAGLTLTADLTVANGGTGVSTLTDGGVLLGSGTGAITALAVLADGAMIVGDGTGDPVAESGATLRTSIGVGTGNAVSFASLTLTTDLSVSNGGTGGSSHTNGGVLLGSGTGTITAMAVLANGAMIVGDGSGDPVAESGATLRTSIGVGTGSTVTFTTLTCTNTIHAAGTTDATSTTTGSLHTHGGLGVVKQFRVNGDLVHTHTTDSITRLGVQAGDVVTGVNNTAFGFQALDLLTAGTDNTAVGHEAGDVVTGSRNTCLGSGAGGNITTGGFNTMIGAFCAASSSSGSDQICLGRSVTTTENNQVAIGNGSARIRNEFDTDAVWSQSSDRRRKTNVNDAVLGLDFINDLRVVTYNLRPVDELPEEWNMDPETVIDTEKTIHSMIAQDVLAAILKAGVDPDTFSGWGADDQGQRISKEAMVMPLIKAVQQLTARLEVLEGV